MIHSVIDNPQRARQLGAEDVLVKPAPGENIRALLRRFVDGEASRLVQGLVPESDGVESDRAEITGGRA